MAQVIRKYLSGGKSESNKPVIVKVDGKEYNYDDIEKNIWGNFDAHAKANNWDPETLQVVRNYLEYSLAGLKSGDLTYGHNVMTGVTPEWESNGQFNTKGKGIFKRDVLNDNTAGANLGTDYFRTLFNTVIPEYKAPELKNIGNLITEDVAQKIVDTLFGGNVLAFNEGWTRLNPKDRYAIFRQALSDLNYDESEYKDVLQFNTNRDALLLLLNNEYDETAGLDLSILNAYSKLGGYGLDTFINGEAKSSSSEILAPTIEELREQWKTDIINSGITDPAAIERELAAREELWRKQLAEGGEYTKALKLQQEVDNLKAALEAYGLFEELQKGKWYANYGNLGLNYVKKVKDWKPREYWHLSDVEIKEKYNNLYSRIRNRVKTNDPNLMMDDISLGEWAITRGGTSGDGDWKAMPGSEDWNNNTVIAFNPKESAYRVMSMHDFPKYRNQIAKLWIKKWNKTNNTNVPDDFLDLLSLIPFEKLGGILKAASGLEFLREQGLRSSGLLTSNSSSVSSDPFSFLKVAHDEFLALEQELATLSGMTVEEYRKLQSKDLEILKNRDEKIFSDPSKITGSDYARFASLGLDVAALATSFVPGYGTAISGILGVTSALTDLGADIFDKSVTLGLMFTNLGLNLGLAGVGMLPGGKSTSIGTKVLKLAPKVIAILGASYAAGPFIDAIKKGSEKGFLNLTREDWKSIYYGLKIASQGGAGAVRGSRARWLKKNLFVEESPEFAGTIKSSNGRNIPLELKHIDALKGKSNKEAVEYLRTVNGKDRKPLLGESEGLAQGWRSKVTSKASFGKLGKQFLITKNDGTVRLKTPEEVTAEFDGMLPGNYIDFVMRNPDILPREQFDMILRAAGRNPKIAYNLAKAGQFHFIPLLQRFFSKNKISFSNRISRAGRVKSPFAAKLQTSSKLPATVPGLGVRTHYQAGREAVPTRLSTERSLVPVSPVRTEFDAGALRAFRHSLNQQALHNAAYPNRPQMFVETSRPLLSKALTSKKYSVEWKGKKSKTYRDQIKTAIKNGDPFVLDKDGVVVIFANKNTKALKINPNEKVAVRINGVEKEVPISEAMAKGWQVTYNKQGGFIYRVLSKFQSGGTIVGNVSSDGKSWHDIIFTPFFDNLYEGLKSGKYTLDDINDMLKRHLHLWAHYDANKGAYVGYDNNVGAYLQDIIDKYGFVNSEGINNGWANNRYTTVKNRRYNTDHRNADGTYSADNVYGGQTDDRRILGRNGDFTPEQLTNYNNKLKDLGIEIYLDGEPDSKSSYYMLRKLGSPENPDNSTKPIDNKTYTDPITGETIERLPDGTYKAVGNSNVNKKPKIQTVGEDVLKYIKNINPADAIALGRALWGENVNNKVSDLMKLMGTALNDPKHQTAILHGNYTAKTLALELAGKINAAAQRPISSDAGLNLAAKLEAAIKATLALQLGNAEDSEMYWKTLQILNQINNENAAELVNVANENRTRVAAAANNRLLAEAARLTANFEQIWLPFFTGVEKRYRDEDTLRRLANIDAWKYKVTSKYLNEIDKILEEYKQDRQLAAKNWKGDADSFYQDWAVNQSPKYQKRMKEVLQQMYDELYSGLSKYYVHTPFILSKTPDLATPGINDNIYQNYGTRYKSGGSLSAADRLALKTTTEINKNIRSASRETYKNIRLDKREHRKAMALVSLLSADLIKKAIGII